MKHANFEVVAITEDLLLLRDIGPWDTHPTITNDVEYVVAAVDSQRGARRLEYFDSEGTRDEIILDEKRRFARFGPAREK